MRHESVVSQSRKKWCPRAGETLVFGHDPLNLRVTTARMMGKQLPRANDQLPGPRARRGRGGSPLKAGLGFLQTAHCSTRPEARGLGGFYDPDVRKHLHPRIAPHQIPDAPGNV